MTALKNLKLIKRFFLLCMYGCTNYINVVEGNEEVADGTLSLDIHIPEVKQFKNYFLQQKVQTNSTKAYKRFWEEVFQCSVNQSNLGVYNQVCNGDEQLSVGKGYYPNTPVHTVIEAVFHVAKALHEYIKMYCNANNTWTFHTETCTVNVSDRKTFKYWSYKFLLSNTYKDGTFKPSGLTDDIEDGDTVRYDVFLFTIERGNYPVWIWKSIRNDTSIRKSMFYNQTHRFLRVWSNSQNVSDIKTIGTCSDECNTGYIKYYDRNSLKSKCCWNCIRCPVNSYTLNNTCVKCKHTEMVDNEYHNSCVNLPVVKISWTSMTTVLLIVICSLGLLLVVFVAVTFMKYYNSKIVRASGRDLSYMILIGILLLFTCPFIFLSESTQTTCMLRRALPGISFLTCYAPLFLRTNRIYRIFDTARMFLSNPSLVSSQSQFIMLCTILAIQLLISVVWFVSKLPVPEALVLTEGYISMHCSGDNSPILLLLNLSLSVIFMVSCTVLAFKTRHFPKNFNEAKYIGITLYITCVAWAVFLPTYFLSPHISSAEFLKEYLMCAICTFIGYVTLFGLFGKKIKMLLYDPKDLARQQTWFVDQNSLVTTMSSVLDQDSPGTRTSSVNLKHLNSRYHRNKTHIITQ